jgi:hypothetical protein
LLALVALALITNVYIKYKGKSNSMPDSSDNPRKMSSVIPSKEGSREAASVLALRLEHGPNSNGAVESALEILQRGGAKVYNDGQYKIAVFTKNLTGQDNNDMIALKLLQEVIGVFGEHNKKMRDKIEFGCGLHRGELISQNKEGKFSFTAIGNLIPTTKRIAQGSNREILLSGEFYKNVMGNVKAEKDAARNVWVLNDVIDRTQHDSFIKGFLGRYNKGN